MSYFVALVIKLLVKLHYYHFFCIMRLMLLFFHLFLEYLSPLTRAIISFFLVIFLSGGVPAILSLLDAHSNYADLHRVAAVVLLRMLQESVQVGREIAAQEGVRILLKSLERG